MDCKRQTKKIIKFINETFREAGKTKAIIGISGGLDSAITAYLLVLALGKENVYGFSLPCGEQKDIKDAELVANRLGIHYETLNIAPAVKSLMKVIGYKEDGSISTGNIKARTRMIVLYDLSAYYNALVVGTGNKTELLLGYFTLYGDGACALEPIGHLYKTEVFELAKYLKIPECILNKKPSAGLWEGQTDEKELGASYKEIDSVLKSLYRENSNEGYISTALLNLVCDRMDKNKFKLEMPKILKDLK